MLLISERGGFEELSGWNVVQRHSDLEEEFRIWLFF